MSSSWIENTVDKPPVVIDIGNAYTKCGFAGDHGPKSIIKSEILRNGQITNIFDYKNENDLRENLMEFLYRIYYKILNINSRDRKIVIIESILNPTVIRKELSDILFKHFQVISVFFMPSHLAALYTLGINTALVIDCGYQDTQIIPIAENYLMTGLFEFSNIASKALYKQLNDNLMKDARVNVNGNDKALQEANITLNDSLIEDIAIRTCFITNINRSRKHANNEELTPKTSDCSYYLPNNMLLTIPGSIREFTFENLFVDTIDSRAIPNLILDTILKSPIDLRKQLAENIVLCGGTTMFNGFKNRLCDELNDLVKTNQNYESLKSIKEFKFHVAPCYENTISWLGASIFSTLEIVDTLSIQNIKYKENPNELPDWFILSNKFKNYDKINHTIS